MAHPDAKKVVTVPTAYMIDSLIDSALEPECPCGHGPGDVGLRRATKNEALRAQLPSDLAFVYWLKCRICARRWEGRVGTFAPAESLSQVET
jgi:hypothetical protein